MSAALPRVGRGALPPLVAKDRELLRSVIEPLQDGDRYLWQNLCLCGCGNISGCGEETEVPSLILLLTSWGIQGQVAAAQAQGGSWSLSVWAVRLWDLPPEHCCGPGALKGMRKGIRSQVHGSKEEGASL